MQRVQCFGPLLLVLLVSATTVGGDIIYDEFLYKHKLYEHLIGLIGLRRPPPGIPLTDQTLSNYDIDQLRQVHHEVANSISSKIESLLDGPQSGQLKNTIFKIARSRPRLFNHNPAAPETRAAVWSDFLNGDVSSYPDKLVDSTSGLSNWKFLDPLFIRESNNLAVVLNAITLRNSLKYSHSLLYNTTKNLRSELWKQMQDHVMMMESYIIANMEARKYQALVANEPTEKHHSKPIHSHHPHHDCSPLINIWKFVHTNKSMQWATFHPVKGHHHHDSSDSLHYIEFQVPMHHHRVEIAFASGTEERDILFKFVVETRNGTHQVSPRAASPSIINHHDFSKYIVYVNRKCPDNPDSSCFTISWNYAQGQVIVTEHHTKLLEFSHDILIQKVSHFAVRSTSGSAKKWKMKSNAFPHNPDFFWCPPSKMFSAYAIDVEEGHKDWYICHTNDSIKPCPSGDWNTSDAIMGTLVLNGNPNKRLGHWGPTEDGNEDSYVVLNPHYRHVPSVFLCADEAKDHRYNYGFRELGSKDCVVEVYSYDKVVYDDYSSTIQTLRINN